MINANDYGRALFELSLEQHCDDAVLEECRTVKEVLIRNPEYVKLLDSPAVPAAERTALVGSAFAGLSAYHMNFLKILCEKHAANQYAACADAFAGLYDQAHGILRATALTAVAMTDAQLQKLTQKLCTITGKNVIVENRVDASVMGGVQLRMGGTQLDGSIASRLDDLRRALNGAIV